jgi:UDP-2,4-diacetamido-2,4,6-trideoxy-beta-L-altropyranose hydrolase
MDQTEKKLLLIRADANTSVGTGHVMRCLALAQAWQDNGGTVTFLMAPGSPSLEQRICLEGMDVLTMSEQPGSNDDAIITAETAKKTESLWVVVDGYQFGAEYQKILKEHNCRILFIDDYGHASHYYADLVLNQNIYADMSFYKKYESYTRFLLGTKFALLRREFLKWSGWHRDIPEVARKILVTLGGSDPGNVTFKIIDALRTIDLVGLEVKVVVGSENPHFKHIHKTMNDLSNFTLIKNVRDMPELMAWADIAISGGGSTCWELAFMGVPGIIITFADNQRLISRHLSQEISYVAIGEYENISNEMLIDAIQLLIISHHKRLEIFQKAQKLVDGEGASRVIQKLKTCETEYENPFFRQ